MLDLQHHDCWLWYDVLLAFVCVGCLTLTELTLQAGTHVAYAQIVRVVVAGGLLKSTEGLLQATTHKQPRQQAAALAPIRSPAPNLLKL